LLGNADGCTPLNISAQFGLLEVTTALVERGADVHKVNKHGFTYLWWLLSPEK
jgi:ankyrin repeat protein